jgi:nicotinamide mononucleotide transporter
MTPLELVAVAFSLACVVLAARRHVGTWPAGIIAVIAYFVIFVRSKLYADAGLQVIFLAQGVYGWWRWTRRAAASPTESPIGVLPWRHRMMIATIVAGASIVIGAALARYTDASSPYIDATVSVLSLAANWLLARRMLENWAVWLTADVLYVGLFLSKGLIASAALYSVFLALAILGWRSWRRSMSGIADRRVGWAL